MFPLEIKRAEPSDLNALLPLVREFYDHFGFAWNEVIKRTLLLEFLNSPEKGRLWVVRSGDRSVGYALVPFYFGLEFDGAVALVDEIFVAPAERGRGIGSRLLEHAVGELSQTGIKVVRLEVDGRHPEAAALYARLGFSSDGRATWTRRQ